MGYITPLCTPVLVPKVGYITAVMYPLFRRFRKNAFFFEIAKTTINVSSGALQAKRQVLQNRVQRLRAHLEGLHEGDDDDALIENLLALIPEEELAELLASVWQGQVSPSMRCHNEK